MTKIWTKSKRTAAFSGRLPLQGLEIVISRQYLDPGILKSSRLITRKKHIIFLPRKTLKILHVKTVVTRHSTQGTHTKTSVFKLHPISVHLFGLISREKYSIDENDFFFF